MERILVICGESRGLDFSLFQIIKPLPIPRHGEKVSIAGGCFEVKNINYDYDAEQISIICKKYYDDSDECKHDHEKLKHNGFSIVRGD